MRNLINEIINLVLFRFLTVMGIGIILVNILSEKSFLQVSIILPGIPNLAKNISLPIKIKTPIFKTFMSIIIPILTRSDIFTSHGQMLMRGMNGIP